MIAPGPNDCCNDCGIGIDCEDPTVFVFTIVDRKPIYGRIGDPGAGFQGYTRGRKVLLCVACARK